MLYERLTCRPVQLYKQNVGFERADALLRDAFCLLDKGGVHLKGGGVLGPHVIELLKACIDESEPIVELCLLKCESLLSTNPSHELSVRMHKQLTRMHDSDCTAAHLAALGDEEWLQDIARSNADFTILTRQDQTALHFAG